tara:strand:- start:24669 stop:24890 length:222 start_codon:yes stop_codon:yes gene_type:complete
MIRDSSLVEAEPIFHKFDQNTKKLLCPNAFFDPADAFYAQKSTTRAEKARHYWTIRSPLPNLQAHFSHGSRLK